jgi:hypothetical protein
MKEKLNEDGYSRLMQIMKGLVPSIRTLGIVTWENPNAIEVLAQENNALNERLKKRLKNGHYSYRQIKGKYDSLENPFFINNISRREVLDLGREGSQESIIFGSMEKDNTLFELVACASGEDIGTCKIWKHIENGQDNYYSEFKGRKFLLPFFDAENVVDENNIFETSEFKDTPKLIQEIRVDELIDDKRTGTSKYNKRGYIYKKLRENTDKFLGVKKQLREGLDHYPTL